MATAEAGKLPRIGDLIDKETGVKYESYKTTQDKLGLQAAMAAIIENPGYKQPSTGKSMPDVVYGLLKDQSQLRMDAVSHDMEKILAGEKLEGIKPGSFLMTEMPKKDAPGLTAEDQTKLAKAAVATRDPGWLVAEGASNVTNFARDIETVVNGVPLDPEQKKAIKGGMDAARQVQTALVSGTQLPAERRGELMGALDTAMNAAEVATGGALEKNPNYEHYREAMRKGITDGMKAVDHAKTVGQLRDAVTPASEGVPSFAPPSTAQQVKE